MMTRTTVGARTIWKRERHFRRFRGIEVRDPFE